MILINPQFNRIKKLGVFSHYVPKSIPLGIGFLAGYLESKNKSVKILDDQITPITEKVLEESVVGLEKPYIFGISCFTAGAGRAYELAKMIKNKFPDAYVIFGGIHSTVLPEEVLATGNVDIVVRREAEEILLKLYESIKAGKDYQDLLGISYFKNGQIVHNPDAPLIADLNTLPSFPYHLFEKYLGHYNLGFISSSRGCPYNCIFCSQRKISSKFYRATDPEKVIAELDLLIDKYHQKDISFFDDNFVVNRERTKKLCELMIAKGYHQNKKVIFSCQTRGDAIDEEILDYLKRAGFTTLGIGMETGSERLIKLIEKGETVEQNVKAVKLAKKFGFTIQSGFIFGLPTETREDRKLTYKLAKDLDLDMAKFNNATPYPGTQLYEMALKDGKINPGKNWENLSACGTFVEGPFKQAPMSYCPSSCSEKELRRDILRANFFFWLAPKRILKILTKGSVSGGWFVLPSRWYLKPKEWYHLILLGGRTLLSMLKAIFI